MRCEVIDLMSLRILIVDDHSGFRGMLKKLIKQQFKEIKIYEAATGESAVKLAAKKRWRLS
jgi:DNA-binding NarL/FixJ family response regulator